MVGLIVGSGIVEAMFKIAVIAVFSLIIPVLMCDAKYFDFGGLMRKERAVRSSNVVYPRMIWPSDVKAVVPVMRCQPAMHVTRPLDEILYSCPLYVIYALLALMTIKDLLPPHLCTSNGILHSSLQ